MCVTAVLNSSFAAEPVQSRVAVDSKTVGAAASPMSSGEVKKVDKDAGKITIKHGPLANLDMPAMTMVFRVQDAVMLDQVKADDKVNFIAEKANGVIMITRIETAN